MFNHSCSLLREVLEKMHPGVSLRCSESTRGSGHSLLQGKFQLGINKQNNLPLEKEIVKSSCWRLLDFSWMQL